MIRQGCNISVAAGINTARRIHHPFDWDAEMHNKIDRFEFVRLIFRFAFFFFFSLTYFIWHMRRRHNKIEYAWLLPNDVEAQRNFAIC